MAKPVVSPPQTEQLAGETSTYVVLMTGSWMLNFGQATLPLRIVTEMRQRTGDVRMKPAWRTADVMPDFPNPWSLGNERSADGVYCEDLAPTAGKFWVQPGVAVSTSGTAGDASITMAASMRTEGALLATATIEIQPELNASSAAYYPIGGLWPLAGCSFLLFGYIFSGVSGTISGMPAWRSCNDGNEPGAWIDLGGEGMANAFDISSDTHFPSSAIAIAQPDPEQFYGQAGLKITATGRGTVRVLVAGRF
jgi:hypothetical protein